MAVVLNPTGQPAFATPVPKRGSSVRPSPSSQWSPLTRGVLRLPSRHPMKSWRPLSFRLAGAAQPFSKAPSGGCRGARKQAVASSNE